MRIRARHYATGASVDVTCTNGIITALEPPGSQSPDRQVGWIAPAFFDLQINGCDGHSFNSERLTIDTVHHVVTVCRRHGIAGLCPTLVTNSFAALVHGLKTICQTRRSRSRHRPCHSRHSSRRPVPFAGRRPARRPSSPTHPPAGLGRISPLPGCGRRSDPSGDAGPRTRRCLVFHRTPGCIRRGRRPGAHCRRRPAAARRGCRRARLSTHLGNGCHATLPRHPNVIWEQLAEDRLWASIICDGHHLPPSVVRSIVGVKTPARTVLTCDASSLAGCPPGRYREWDQDFEVLPEGKVVVPGTAYLAGSWAFADLCVGNVMRFAGVSLRDAVDMAGEDARIARLAAAPPGSRTTGGPGTIRLGAGRRRSRFWLRVIRPLRPAKLDGCASDWI